MSEKWEEWKNASVTQCDKSDLVDLYSVAIHTEKSKAERMLEFLVQIKNPYLFRVGDIAVKVVYNKRCVSLQEQIESLVQTNLHKSDHGACR